MSANSSENQNRPLVSIIIPFFNREEFLNEAIESVLSQNEKNWELLLINDGSTDSSVEIAQAYVERYPSKIYLLNHENVENRGASASRNLGIGKAKGDYITFLDSDDVFFSDTIRKELEAFDKNPEADAVCGTLECWYSWSQEAEKWEKDFKIDLVLQTEKLYRPPELLVHNLIAGGRKPGMNCVILKRDFAKKTALFEEDYTHVGEDQVFWTKVSLYGSVYVTDEVFAKYRQHPASTCAVETQDGKDFQSLDIFLNWLENYMLEKNVDNKDLWNALRRFKRTHYLGTKFHKLKRIYRRALPLYVRYKMRDQLTKLKKFLLRSAHRHK